MKEEDKQVKVTTPPIHEHYNSETDEMELCGHVFCPYGYVGIEVVNKKYSNHG